jgi:hypothetical protein
MPSNVWLRRMPPHWEKTVFWDGPQGGWQLRGSPGTVSRRGCAVLIDGKYNGSVARNFVYDVITGRT